jgi:hypothetical protein
MDIPPQKRGRVKISILLLIASLSAAGDETGPPRVYPSGFSIAVKLGGELSEALPTKFGNQLDQQPIVLQPQDVPEVTPIDTTGENRIERQVSLSAGLIDLVNHLCHAKAVDRIEPGFFDQYVRNLASLSTANPQPPNIVDPRYWTDDVINDQLSYFNQMIGMIMAINFSHQYLGHYSKYSSKMIGEGARITPINDFLTDAEWQVSVRAGAVNALNCALSTDGPRALFDAIDRMPQRPPWADYIVPPRTDLKKLNKQLARWEDDFFHGQFR